MPDFRRVLVVDDEENIRRLLRLILTRMSKHRVHVQEASSAEDGMAMLRKEPFDLIVSDYRMAGKTGVDLLEVALREQPACARILITAFGEMDIGVEAINRGHVDGFLRKPWDNARLVALVDSLLAVRGAGATAAPGIAEPAPAAPPVDAERAELERKLAEVTRNMQKLRVRLGLGSLSPEGYQRAVDELSRERAEIETRLMRKST